MEMACHVSARPATCNRACQTPGRTCSIGTDGQALESSQRGGCDGCIGDVIFYVSLMDGKPCATQYQPNINPLCNPLPTLCEVGDNITTNIRPIEACDGALESSRRDRKHATLLVGLIGAWFRGGWTSCKLPFQPFVQPFEQPFVPALWPYSCEDFEESAGRVNLVAC